MIFFDSKLPKVIKSHVDKSLSKLVRKCSRTDFFKFTHFLKKSMALCKHCQIVIFHILGNVYNLFEQCKIFFVYLHISPSPCHPFIYCVNYLFHFVPHVLILSKCQRGFNLLSSLGYSNKFFVILQILSSMFEIDVFSIIDSKVFGVTFGVNFLLPIVE